MVMQNSCTKNKTFWTVFLNAIKNDALCLATTELQSWKLFGNY